MILGHIGRNHLIFNDIYSTVSANGAVFGCQPSSDTITSYDSDKKNLFIGWGRIDNKAQLESRLHTTETVSELLHAAYLTWGKVFPTHIRGDWGYAHYNLETRELFLARDHNSTLPLFYLVHDGDLIYSTSLEPLLNLRKSFNPRFALGILTLWKPGSGADTIFDGIMKVPPGHYLTFKSGNVQLHKYWNIEDIKERNYSNVQDYSDELLELMKEAIRCRIDGKSKVASMLSGGLDSSTVSVLASRQVEKLTTFSHVPLLVDPAFQSKRCIPDESPYIDQIVATRPNIHSVKLKSGHISPLKGIEKYIDAFNTIIHASGNAFWLMDLFETASQQEYDVLLSGKCGNASISYAGRPELLPLQFSAHDIKQKWAKPMLGRFLDYRRFLAIHSKGYVRKEAMREYGVKMDVLLHHSALKSWVKSTREDISHLLKILHRYTPIDSERAFNTKILDPTADSRIVEFCASIPNHVFFNDKQENKQVLRRMMHGILPDEVLFSRKKGLQSSDIAHRIRVDIPEIVSLSQRYVKNPSFAYLIDTEKFSRDVERLRVDESVYLTGLLKTIMLGMFLEKNGFST
jgi:asparagine synthase (glutamine-hydrolysing)